MIVPRDGDLDVPRGIPEPVSRSIWRSAMWSGAVAALLGAALAVCVALVCWLPDAGVSGHPTSAIRAGLLAFLAAQHGGVTLDGTHAAFVPLGMLALAAVIAWRAGSALADTGRRLGVTGVGRMAAAGLVSAACYAIACMVLVPFASLGTSEAPLIAVGISGFLLYVCLAGAALCTCSPPVREELARRLGSVLGDGLRAAAGVVAVYLGAGALLVAGSLVVHAGRVMDLFRLVGGGVSGIPVAVLDVLAVPNAAIAGSAYLAGPGFAVGSGTTVDAFSTSHGTLPAFPLLGALPTGDGANILVMAWIALTLAAAGLLVARLVARRGAVDAMRAAAVAAAASGVAMAVLAWLAGGSVGSHRLATVGPSPWQVGLAVAGETAAIAVPVLGGWLLWRYLAVLVAAARAKAAAAPPPDELVTAGAADEQ